MNLLIVDDTPSLRKTMRIALEAMKHTVHDAADGARALELLLHQPIDVALVDLRLGREEGLDLLPKLLQAAPGLQIIIITAYATVETAVEAIKRGAFDYLPKPFTPDQLRLVLERCGKHQRLSTRIEELEDQVRRTIPEADLQTEEPIMRGALALAFKAAESEATILIRGESGTGKGVLARAIHARSPRAAGPFVTVHSPSLSGDLLESELFGHVRGAFTGAVRDTVGKVATAAGGTLFLDEVGDLPAAVQPKLLRLLQEKRYERVGETQTRSSDVRILAATNRPLEADAAAGRFREDLLYRLNVIEVTMPALRHRPRDVLPLAIHLLGFFTRQSGKKVTGFTPEAQRAIQMSSWPGNVRELRNAVERGVILTSDVTVGIGDLPSQIGSPVRPGVEVGGRVTLEHLEAEHIRRILAATPTLDEAAEVLGIDPSTLYRKRKRYGI